MSQQPNKTAYPAWRDKFTDRQRDLIQWSREYEHKPFGDDGHNAKLTIAGMATALDEQQRRIDELEAQVQQISNWYHGGPEMTDRAIYTPVHTDWLHRGERLIPIPLTFVNTRSNDEPVPPMVIRVQGDQWTDEEVIVFPDSPTGPIKRPNRDA